jgi:hypothetical protein
MNRFIDAYTKPDTTECIPVFNPAYRRVVSFSEQAVSAQSSTVKVNSMDIWTPATFVDPLDPVK